MLLLSRLGTDVALGENGHDSRGRDRGAVDDIVLLCRGPVRRGSGGEARYDTGRDGRGGVAQRAA